MCNISKCECILQVHWALYPTRVFGYCEASLDYCVNCLKTHKSLHEIVCALCRGGAKAAVEDGVRESEKSNRRKSAEAITWVCPFHKSKLMINTCNFINHIECVCCNTSFRKYNTWRALYRLHLRAAMSKVMYPVDKIKCVRESFIATLFLLPAFFTHIRHLWCTVWNIFTQQIW